MNRVKPLSELENKPKICVHPRSLLAGYPKSHSLQGKIIPFIIIKLKLIGPLPTKC